jgi:hypothetical protein
VRDLTLLAVALLLVVSAGTVGAQPDEPRGWDYEIGFDAALERIDVTLVFRGFMPRRLHLIDPEAHGAIRPLDTAPTAGSLRPLPGNRGFAPALRDGRLRYTVDVNALVARGRKNENTQRVGRDLVTRPGLVLLRPGLWPEDARVRVRVRPPPGFTVCVPWPEAQDGYVIESVALTTLARIALGRFARETVRDLDTDLTICVLDERHAVSTVELRRWISDCAKPVADLFHGFPVARLQVLVQPTRRDRGRPVHFARAMRGGGALVHLTIAADASASALHGDWITVHELIHLGMPWHTPGGRWFGEGFVSYYQDTLRARAGFITPPEAWQRLESWFVRGRSSGGRRTLLEESRLMTPRYAYHRVYYGGAALALMMDVEIRRRFPERSFDDVMRFLHRTYGRSQEAYTGPELMAAVDAWLGVPICKPLADRYLASRRFPDLRAAYAALGIEVVSGVLRLRNDAPQAADRVSITRP